VLALTLDGTQEKWRFERSLSPLAGELAIANDVVYVMSPVEERQQTPAAAQEFALYALGRDSGQVLSRVPLPGRAVSSPVVSRGRIYAGMGNSAISELGEDETGGLVCYGLPD
jgi:outer membrane protein assembly factor BamB